jgi:predicted deacylase
MRTTVSDALRAAAPGARIDGTIAVGSMASGSLLGIPFVAVRGARPGRTLWINGHVHGNEINGIVAALDFVNGLDRASMAGNVVVSSTANPLGLDARRKNAPQDDNDLDQAFPGRPDGYTTERFAHGLYENIRAVAPDLVISMHSQGTHMVSRTYAVYKQPPDAPVTGATLFPYMGGFRPAVVCRMSVERGSGEILGNHAGALDYQLNAIGIPTFMIELGTGQRADPAEVALGLAGYTDVARRLAILPGAPGPAPATLRHVTRRGHVPISSGGLFRASRKPAEFVRAGEPFGEIMNIHGHVVERPALDRDCVIIGIRVDPVVHTGDRVAYVATEWTDTAN